MRDAQLMGAQAALALRSAELGTDAARLRADAHRDQVWPPVIGYLKRRSSRLDRAITGCKAVNKCSAELKVQGCLNVWLGRLGGQFSGPDQGLYLL